MPFAREAPAFIETLFSVYVLSAGYNAMQSILLESFLFWLVVGTCLFVSSYAIAQGTGKRLWIVLGLASGLAVVALGAVLVFAVDTDAKAIRRTIRTIETAVRNNDVPTVLANLSSNAEPLKKLVNSQLPDVKIERAKVSELKIDEINKTTSPPRAKVSFRGMIAGVDSTGTPFSALERFNMVELRQEQDGVWRVTGHIELERRF